METIMSVRTILVAGAAACLLQLGACGGSDSKSTPVVPIFEVIQSTATIDGTVRAMTVWNTTNLIRVGDQEGDAFVGGSRGFVSFDLSTIPAAATITGATLRMYVFDSEGDPIADLGSLGVSHVDIGDTLDPADWAAGTIAALFGILTLDASVGWKTLDVTAQVLADRVAARPRSQYRLEFSASDANADAGNDYVYFEDGDNTGATGNLPQLELTYTTP